MVMRFAGDRHKLGEMVSEETWTRVLDVGDFGDWPALRARLATAGGFGDLASFLHPSGCRVPGEDVPRRHGEVSPRQRLADITCPFVVPFVSVVSRQRRRAASTGPSFNPSTRESARADPQTRNIVATWRQPKGPFLEFLESFRAIQAVVDPLAPSCSRSQGASLRPPKREL